MRIDKSQQSVWLDPVDPAFYNDPYPAYHAIRAQTPVFKWEQYGIWCFARHEDVNALLRDRRFGRQILHVASREELGWPETPRHLKPFYDFESHSLLELEPPVHTRLRGLVNRSFLSRQVERLRPQITSLANGLIDRFEEQGDLDSRNKCDAAKVVLRWDGPTLSSPRRRGSRSTTGMPVVDRRIG